MIRFYETGNDQAFNAFLLVKYDVSRNYFDFEVVYPEPSDLANPIDPSIAQFCFPITSNFSKSERFIFFLTGSESNPTYGFVQQDCTGPDPIAFCIISDFFVPDKHFKTIEQFIEKYKMSSKSIAQTFLHRSLSLGFRQSCIQYEQDCIKNYIQQLFTLLDPYLVGVLVVSICLDNRFLVLSSSLEKVSLFAFSLLFLIYPLPWPGVFIPMLPFRHQDTLLAPFPFIIGLHSSLIQHIKSTDMESHIMFNVDAPLAATVRTIELPPEIHKLINTYSKKIKDSQLDIDVIKSSTKQLFVNTISYGLGIKSDKPSDLLSKWNKLRIQTDLPEFPLAICASQVVLQLMREIEQGIESDVYEQYWPSKNSKSVRIIKPVRIVHPVAPTGVNSSIMNEISRIASSFNTRTIPIDDLIRQRRETEKSRKPPPLENPEHASFSQKKAMFETARNDIDPNVHMLNARKARSQTIKTHVEPEKKSGFFSWLK